MESSISINKSMRALTVIFERINLTDRAALVNQTSAFNPLHIYRTYIANHLGSFLGVDTSLIYSALQRPQTPDKGDLFLPIPALRVKEKKPQELAHLIRENLPGSSLIERSAVEGTYVQFFFQTESLTRLVLPLILENGDNYESDYRLGLYDPNNPDAGRKRIIVEFGSPNIAKPFHAGHLRSTIIGGFLANLYEEAGWEVTRMNYLGDWGKQYGVLGVGFSQLGVQDALERDPIAHLFDVYVKISALGRKEQENMENMRNVIANEKLQGHRMADMEQGLELFQANSVDERAMRRR